MKASSLAVLALLVASPLFAQGRSGNIAPPPPVNVRLTFQLIEADSFTGDDADIRPIVTELRKLFRFSGYRLASKSVLTATAYPRSSVSQRITDPDGHNYIIESEVSGNSETVRLAVVLYVLDTQPTSNGSYAPRTLITASVSLADGKTVVLGSAQANQDSRALILAVTPTINP